ncbi:MAG: TonB family protein [Gemmatimonadota bacterium]
MTLAALLLLSLAPQTVVEGVVSTAGGGPLAYARVQVVGDTLSDWTDERGFYRLEGLDRGEWRVRVTHPGHESLDLAVAVPGDRAVRLDVTLEPRPGPPVDALASFEPFRVEYTLPALLNEREMKDLMERRYPPELARRGIGGEAVLLVWLDERGRVVRARVASSSGQSPLDSVALAVSDSMRFRPARIGSDSLRVIVRLPIRFTVPDTVPDEG